MDSALHILEIVVALIVAVVCCGAVPFALRVTAQLATIVAELKGVARREQTQDAAIADLRSDVTDLQIGRGPSRPHLAR